MKHQVTVVIITRNHAQTLLRTLARVMSFETAPIIVVDNSSTDDTTRLVRKKYPTVRLIALQKNMGPRARIIGVRAARTPYVAFCDDDSWWMPGSFDKAAYYFKRFPAIGLLAAKVLLHGKRVDPVCKALTTGQISRDPNMPGVPVLGFLPRGSIVRRSAFLAASGYGFSLRVDKRKEELHLAVKMRIHGWKLTYVPTITAHHYPLRTLTATSQTTGLSRVRLIG